MNESNIECGAAENLPSEQFEPCVHHYRVIHQYSRH